ncbi:MAG TPA: HlyD family efflux transporter periplasmic adaptor subunit, partial [Candidatus Acidoferrum sp.]|nr:HlyD family efflux transporter periplasmic adaptor subunit [Candidatus Acidoferrum sp.]
ITLPETVSGPFVLIPLQGTDPIRAARGGTVTAVRVREGQAVTRGDPMFVIRSSTVGDRAAELAGLETQLQGSGEGRRNARQKYESQRQSDEAESSRLARRTAHLTQKLEENRAIRAVKEDRFRTDLEIQRNTIDITLKETEFKRTEYALARELAERFERYHKEGAISWLDYKNRELEMTKLAVEVQQLDRTLETARLRLNQLAAEQETWEKEWRMGAADLEAENREVRTSLEKLRQSAAARDAEYREVERRLTEEASKAKSRAGALRDDLGASRGGDLSLPALCSGTLLRLNIKGAGAVVQEGELLGELACAGERLQAEVLAPQSGVGLIKPGQPVKLLYDAFPYQRYGMRYGTIRWVSPASVQVKDQPVFRILVNIQDEAVVVKGQPRPLLAGMEGKADIVIGKRSLLSFAFEPIRQLKENFSVPTP